MEIIYSGALVLMISHFLFRVSINIFVIAVNFKRKYHPSLLVNP
jgi:hypothetical protein